MDIIFADGIYFKEPSERAPEYIKGSISFKVEEVKKFLDAHVNNAGYVTVDIKVSKGGKTYCALNTFVPQKPNMERESVTVDISKQDDETSIPF